jgi:prenylated cyclic peptide (anacyclamide/piricyclamide family)
MTKKNLKPQQAAPVQREINTTSSVGGTGLTPDSFYTKLRSRDTGPDDSVGYSSPVG